MSRYNRLAPDIVNKVLDRMTEGGTLKEVSEDTGVASKTVWNLEKEFPLWAFFRKKEE